MVSVLFVNVQMTNATGTEVVIRDLALGMARRGHRVAVYSPRLGEPAQRLIACGVQVIDDLDQLTWRPDVIHGHHHTPTVAALDHFPDTPAIWVCHDRLQPEDIPPIHRAIRRYVAVDRSCRERLAVEACIDPNMVDVIHNAVDLERFALRAAWTGTPMRALVFSNQAIAGGYLDMIQAACARRGISVDTVGTLAGGVNVEPERVLGDYELVFAKARCALEALVSGCAVVLVDQVGLGTVVTSSTVDVQRDWNFGARCLQGRHTVDSIGHEIDMVDAADARATAEHVRGVAGLSDAIARYESLYASVIRGGVPVAEPVGVSSLNRLLGYTASLERQVRATSGAVGTVALPPEVCAQIELRAGPIPVGLEPGQRFELDVTIINRSRETLMSLPPYPVHAGYHWYHDDPELDVFEGLRTQLPKALPTDGTVTVRLAVEAPCAPGRWRLRLSLVQELVMWFDQQSPAHACELEILLGDRIDPHDGLVSLESLIASIEHRLDHPVPVVRTARVGTLAFVEGDHAVPNHAVVFVESATYLDRALASRPAAVLTTAELAELVPDDVGVLLASDPRRTFFAVHNALVRHTTFYGALAPTEIHPTAKVHLRAHVDPLGVVIGPGCTIGPMATIVGQVSIGANSRVDAGAVVGATGFQTSSVRLGHVELEHVGSVEIGENCHVHANAVIARGALAVPTVIGDGCQIGNGAFVSHECVLGASVFVGHNATVNGHVTIGDEAWIGPGAVVVNGVALGARCHVALGSTLIADVRPDERVAGLPAMHQHTMFRHAASIRRAGRRG